MRMLKEYWPAREESNKCIRTDADGTAEHVLLAVHEPMLLKEVYAGRSIDETRGEHDLLNQLITTEFPIPIIGAAGTGKSHIIRWLDAKLKVHKDCTNWHIRRIPKGASLRLVLTIILEGLDGEDFEDARQQVQLVGNDLEVEDLAEYFINFIGQELNALHQANLIKIDRFRETKEIASEVEKNRICAVSRHAKPKKGLRDLLGDSNFKERLVGKDKCIYQIARRFTEITTAEEMGSEDFRDEFLLDDLDFTNDFNLDNLSLEARDYVKDANLLSDKNMHIEAVSMLNEVLPAATQRAFGQFYQFKTGSFSDLFSLIRVHLKKKQKTLVILIEDLAMISAISDTLLDNLLIEADREGDEVYCPMRSAFAVTDGSIAMDLYARKSGTISTRQAEWYIEEKISDEGATLGRIEDFCGRYLNAARIGSDKLFDGYDASKVDGDWPAIFSSENLEEKEEVAKFGFSPKGYPLFPFNSSAIHALAEIYCKRDGQLRFQPRSIIRNILKNILEPFREKYLRNDFPSIEISNSVALHISSELELELQTELRDIRVQTLVKIWGFGANNLSELAGRLNPDIAREFCCETLVETLTETTPIFPGKSSKPPQVVPLYDKPVLVDPTKPFTVTVEDKFKEVDEYFKGKGKIPQAIAQDIRRDLAEALKAWWSSKYYGGWSGMAQLPKISERNVIGINIPYNTNNPDVLKTFGYFGKKNGTGYDDQAIKHKGYLIALLRFTSKGDWNYTEGYEDYCRYNDFRNEWVIEASRSLVDKTRVESATNIVQHMQRAIIFDPTIVGKKHSEKLNIICQSAGAIKESTVPTGLLDWDDLKSEMLGDWDEEQNIWLLNFLPGSKNYAVEGDEIKRLSLGSLSDKVDLPRQVNAVVRKVERELKQIFESIKLIEGCGTQESFSKILNDFKHLIATLSSEKIFDKDVFGMTAGNAKKLIDDIIDGNNWSAVKALLELFGPQVDEIAKVKSVNNIDVGKLKQLNILFKRWDELYEATALKLRVENENRGYNEKELVREQVIETVCDFDSSLCAIQEAFCE